MHASTKRPHGCQIIMVFRERVTKGYETLGLRKPRCSLWCRSRLEFIIRVDVLIKRYKSECKWTGRRDQRQE